MIIRANHKEHFVTICNKTLRDPDLSWKARGLLAFFLTHDNNYQIRIDNLHLFSHCDGEASITSGIKELKAKGYMTFQRKQDPKTKTWQAGEWVILEEIPLAAGKPEPGKPRSRLSPVREYCLDIKKDQEEERPRRKKEQGKKGFLEAFDPLDLPKALHKHEPVREAWAEFVQHRREKGCKITPLAWKKLIKTMLPHSPEEIVAAINRSVESGWRGLFFRKTRPVAGVSTMLDLRGRLLADALDSLSIPYRSQDVTLFLRQMKTIHNDLPDNLTAMLDFDSWLEEWVEFFKGKQETFPASSFLQLGIGGVRWREFLSVCRRKHQYDFETGEWRP
uniref:Uncharacterized protein n=1 Tax=viral metagenome TaxID=1070528 RepID=A0A6M3IMX8_9ZZZZ